MKEEHYSNNCLKETLEDLKLFQQTNYCYNYIKKKFSNLDDEKIESHADIASASFRQAHEFLISASNADLSTSPLLYSYALNNFAKGMGYLLYTDDTLNLFKKHGFEVEDEKIGDNILNTFITINEYGVTKFILKAFDNYELEKQDISFKLLLSQIPGLENIYEKTTLDNPNVGKIENGNKWRFIIECPNSENIDNVFKICEEYGFRADLLNNKLYCYFNMIGIEKIEKNQNIKNNLFFKDYIILPNQFIDGTHDINLIYYCYLIIMGYGMIVRYNPYKWEKFIDPKISNEYLLIELSVDNCINNFLAILHNKIMGYTYIEDKYDDKKIIKIIKDSIPMIMNEINKKIESYNKQTGAKELLPWPKMH